MGKRVMGRRTEPALLVVLSLAGMLLAAHCGKRASQGEPTGRDSSALPVASIVDGGRSQDAAATSAAASSAAARTSTDGGDWASASDAEAKASLPSTDATATAVALGDGASPPDDSGVLPPARAQGPEIVGPGEFCGDEGCAAAQGLIEEPPDDGTTLPPDVPLEATVEDGRHTWALIRVPGRGPDYDRIKAAGGGARWVLWLARLDPATDPEEGEGYRRSGAVRLYDFGMAADELVRDCEPGVESGLRAGDLDADREVEITVIAAVAASGVLKSGEECGAVAFIVGGDDFGIQQRFTREYRWVLNDAGGATAVGRFTTWHFDEENGGGATAVHVTEVVTLRDEFSGDWADDETGTVPGRRRRESGRQEVVCPYVPGEDVWRCPPSPPLGDAFFRNADQVLSPPNPMWFGPA